MKSMRQSRNQLLTNLIWRGQSICDDAVLRRWRRMRVVLLERPLDHGARRRVVVQRLTVPDSAILRWR